MQVRDELRLQTQDLQNLRINNSEIVGLPAPIAQNGETDETVLVNALNTLVGLPKPIRPEDIDISHPLKSQRRDNKPVHVVRFISQKTKYEVLTAKKSEANRQFKFRDNDVYVNEHVNEKKTDPFSQQLKNVRNH